MRALADWSDDLWTDAPDLSTPNIDTGPIDSFIDEVMLPPTPVFDTAAIDQFITDVQTPGTLPDGVNTVPNAGTGTTPDYSIYTGQTPTDTANPLPDQVIAGGGGNIPNDWPTGSGGPSLQDVAQFLKALTSSGVLSAAAQGTRGARPIGSASQFPIGASNRQPVKLPNGVIIPAGSTRMPDGSIQLPTGQVYPASVVNAMPGGSGMTSINAPMLIAGAGLLFMLFS